MEVFGLLHLLNSLLPSPAQKREDASIPPPPADAENTVAPPVSQPQPNACLDFFAKHEQRAKQRKK